MRRRLLEIQHGTRRGSPEEHSVALESIVSALDIDLQAFNSVHSDADGVHSDTDGELEPEWLCCE